MKEGESWGWGSGERQVRTFGEEVPVSAIFPYKDVDVEAGSKYFSEFLSHFSGFVE